MSARRMHVWETENKSYVTVQQQQLGVCQVIAALGQYLTCGLLAVASVMSLFSSLGSFQFFCSSLINRTNFIAWNKYTQHSQFVLQNPEVSTFSHNANLRGQVGQSCLCLQAIFLKL